MAGRQVGANRDAAPCVRMACLAMGTRFELLLSGVDPMALRVVGEACIEEILRLHRVFSPFTRDSETARVNRLAHVQAVPVGRDLEDLLEICRQMHRLTLGAFDPTIGPCMEAWGMRASAGSPEQAARARARVGMDLVAIEGGRVRFRHAGTRLDFGAIAKGFALDRVREILADEGVCDAFCHAGCSSMVAMGPHTWRVRVGEDGPEFDLRDAAMGVSAIDGRVRVVDGQERGHIIDPHTGEPVRHARTAYAVGSSCCRCDAVSTAALIDAGSHLLAACDRVGVQDQDGSWSEYAGDARRRRRTA